MEESPFLLETDDPDIQNLIQDYEPLGVPPIPTPVHPTTNVHPNSNPNPNPSVEPQKNDLIELLASPSVVRPARSASVPLDQQDYITTVFSSGGESAG